MGNNFSKAEITCTVTSADRKKIDNLKYHEALNPNLIKTSSRKKILYKASQTNLLNYEEYFIRKKTGYWKTFLTGGTFLEHICTMTFIIPHSYDKRIGLLPVFVFHFDPWKNFPHVIQILKPVLEEQK